MKKEISENLYNYIFFRAYTTQLYKVDKIELDPEIIRSNIVGTVFKLSIILIYGFASIGLIVFSFFKENFIVLINEYTAPVLIVFVLSTMKIWEKSFEKNNKAVRIITYYTKKIEEDFAITKQKARIFNKILFWLGVFYMFSMYMVYINQ